jgi:hypothetical protein
MDKEILSHIWTIRFVEDLCSYNVHGPSIRNEAR